ncbi:MAG: phytanoyl-CoA dioxygenase family protein [Chloroflexi bacterium]|nr:phytanoyl-CoA dioxygenase family protein [Chloroflexota bacterium]
MNTREKFLYDLQGFLLVKDFLTAEEVKALNDAFDANWDKRIDDPNSHAAGKLVGDHPRGHFSGMLAWEKPWHQPFRNLLAHPKLIPYLNTMFGRGWKMDHSPFMLTSTAGAEGLRLHGSTSHLFDGSQYYTYANGQMRCGMIVCQFQLGDVNTGDGGLCVIPGSHKANFACPEEILIYEQNQEIVYNIPCKAGDMVIFNEATIHGTLPWTAKHERRSLLYRYSPKYLHFAGGSYTTSQPEWVSELTEAQQAVLEPPYIYNRPLVEDDGIAVVRPRRER